MLAYRVPRVPSTPRIAIWRKLRSLGVAQIGDGLVALPEDARTREQLEWVAADVDAAGGSAILWRAEMLSARDEQRLVAQLQQARAEEYRALIVQAEQARAGPVADQARRWTGCVVSCGGSDAGTTSRRRSRSSARRAVEALAGRSGQPTSTGTGGARA